MALTDLERAMLDFEGQWFRYQGAKEQQIRDLFDLKPTAYLQRLNTLIDRPDALAYAPVTVKRLQRQREARGAVRAQRARHG